MISRLAARNESVVLRRGVLGLLAVLWLNMAMLPCAMAFQADDCPHCPPAEAHDAHHKMGAHEGHQQAVAKAPCESAQVDCCDEIAASVDGRGSNFEQRPALDIAFVMPTMPNGHATLGRTDNRRATDPPEIIGSSPPLRKLYCVYLK